MGIPWAELQSNLHKTIELLTKKFYLAVKFLTFHLQIKNIFEANWNCLTFSLVK